MISLHLKKAKGRFSYPNTGAIMGFLHLPEHMPDRLRNDVVAALAEFVGTFLFLLFAFAACQVANIIPKGDTEPAEAQTLRIIYIALAFAVSLAINCWWTYRISGGQLNPAVCYILQSIHIGDMSGTNQLTRSLSRSTSSAPCQACAPSTSCVRRLSPRSQPQVSQAQPSRAPCGWT